MSKAQSAWPKLVGARRLLAAQKGDHACRFALISPAWHSQAAYWLAALHCGIAIE